MARWLWAILLALSIAATQFLAEPRLLGAAALPASPRGVSTSGADFNGDGFDDLAVSAFDSTDEEAFGSVHIVYGSENGLVKHGSLWLSAEKLFGRSREDRVLFGYALAAGEFDGDGYTDLAIGAPGSTVAGEALAGGVAIVYGSESGLDVGRRQFLSQATTGIDGAAEEEDQFGSALTVADFGRGPEEDLAISVPEEDTNDGYNSGAVHIVYGSARGLDPIESQVWRQSSPGVDGRGGDSDGFGKSLVSGNLGGTSHADLAVGSPSDHFYDSWEHGNGTVHVLYGSAEGLTTRGSQRFSKRGPGITEVDDEEGVAGFAQALAIGHFTGGRYADLAVSSWERPGDEDTTSGSVTIFSGSPSGLTAARQVWSQASFGIAGKPEWDDHFGDELAVGDFGHDIDGTHYDDLAVGVGESIGKKWSGAVQIIYGGPLGLTGSSSQFLSQQTAGVAGVAEDGDDFGAALGVGDFGRNRGHTHYDDLAVGIPSETLDSRDHTGAFSVLYGGQSGLTGKTSQFWTRASLVRSLPMSSDSTRFGGSFNS